MNNIIEWFDDAKTSKSKEYWKNENGELHGRQRWWRRNGQLWIDCFYKNGKLHGRYRWWMNNRELWDDDFYMNGELMTFKEYEKNMNIMLDTLGKIMFSRYDCLDSDKNLDNYFQVIPPELFGIISNYALYKN